VPTPAQGLLPLPACAAPPWGTREAPSRHAASRALTAPGRAATPVAGRRCPLTTPLASCHRTAATREAARLVWGSCEVPLTAALPPVSPARRGLLWGRTAAQDVTVVPSAVDRADRCGDQPGRPQGRPGPAPEVAVHARGLRARGVRRRLARTASAVGPAAGEERGGPPLGRGRGALPGLHVPRSPRHSIRDRRPRLTRGQWRGLALHGGRRAPLHIWPVCPGTPQRLGASAARFTVSAAGVG
jgi:hypothetical protein